MTPTPATPGPPEPTASLRADPAEVTPGSPMTVGLHLTNRLAEPSRFAVEVLGFEPGWVDAPPVAGPVAPDQEVVVGLRFTLPVGHPASRLVGGVSAHPIDDAGRARGPAVRTEVVLSVGDSALIAASLVPPEVRGRHRARFDVVLQNRGPAPLRVDLSSVVPDDDLEVRLPRGVPVLNPGSEVRVPAEVRANKSVMGQETRRPFGVRVQGRTTPVLLEGAFLQRPVRAAWLLKAVAIAVVLALWAAVAVVGITALNNHLKKTATSRVLAAEPPLPAAPTPHGAAATSTTTTTQPGSHPTTANQGGGSGSGSGPAKSGGGSGSGSSGGSGSAKSGGGAAPAAAAPAPTAKSGGETVSGRVTGPNPGQVTVVIAPTSLVDQPLAQDNLLSTTTGPLGKIPASLAADVFADPVSAVTNPTMSRLTGADGYWSFAGVQAPGTYLVTISKPGYDTVEDIVTLTSGSTPQPLQTALNAGTGSISGTTFGPSGRIGGVQLTITDGTVSLVTRTPTVGATGTWSIGGLNTPDTYLVTATLPGFGTQITTVTLAAGGTAKGVSLTMTPGVGTITGTITSSTHPAGLGGATVTATNGTVTLSATTTTVSPVGSFSLPNLPIPGTYAVTVSEQGWVSQTQQVQLTGNAAVNANLLPSTAEVTGTVTAVGGGGLPDAGVILSNDTTTFKTLTESLAPVGGFDIEGVPPGQYVLTVEDFGYTTQSAEVTVAAGDMKTVNLALPFVGSTVQATASIQGNVASLFNAEAIPGATIELDGAPLPPPGVHTDGNGNYEINGVLPGIHDVTAIENGFQTSTVSVSVPLGGVAFAPRLLLPALDELFGVVSSNAGGTVPNPTVTITNPSNPGACSVAANTCQVITPTDAAQGGYEIDGLQQGTYTLTVAGPPELTDLFGTKTFTVTMGLDAAPMEFNVALDLEGYVVDTLEAQAQGGPIPVSQVTVTLTDSHGNSSSALSTSTGGGPDQAAVPFPNNGVGGAQDPTGTALTATFSAPDGATTSPVALTAEPNLPTATVFLATPFTGPTVTLQFPYNEPTGTVTCSLGSPSCPGLNIPPTVQLTGDFGFTTTSPGQAGTPIVRTVTGNVQADHTYSFAGLLTGLLPSQVTLSVSDSTGAFQSTSVTAVPVASGWQQSIELKPTAGPVTGTVAPVSGVTATVEPTVPTVTVVNGVINWVDPADGSVPHEAEPGVYLVTFSASGFDPSQVSVTVPLQDCSLGCPPPTTLAVTLTPHFTLAVTPTFTALPGVAGPTVTVSEKGGLTLGPTPLSSGTASFGGLSVANAPFSYTVTAPGYSGFTGAVSLTTAGSGLVTETPDLTANEEGVIEGQVEGVINGHPSDLAGVTVTAVDASSSSCGHVVAATTDIHGLFSLVTDPTTSAPAGNSGLCVGDVYDLTATPPAGYANGTATVTVVAGVNTENFNLAASPLVVQLHVVDSVTGDAVTTATVTAVSGSGRSPVTAVNAGGGNYTATIDPTTYSFNVSAPGYASLSVGPIPYVPGETPLAVPVSLVLDENTVTGKALTPGSPSATGLPGVIVDLFSAGSGAMVGSGTTDATGTYTITNVPDGSYTETATLAGYTFVVPSPQSFSTTFPTTSVNVNLTANPVPLSISVSSTAGANLDGATLKITPLTGSGIATCTGGGQTATLVGRGQGTTQTATVTTGGASFPQVHPDSYQVTIDTSSLTPSHPSQTGSTTDVTVCPTGLTSPSSPTFSEQEGGISGLVTVPGGLVTSATVDLYTGGTPTGTPLTPGVACSASPCGDAGTYQAYVALNSNYTVVVSATGGYQSQQTVTPTLTQTNPTTSVPASLVPDNQTVEITVTSGPGGTPIALDNPTVSLTSTTDSTSYTTPSVSGDVATFSNVVPDTYTVAYSDGDVSGSASLVVHIQDPSNPVTATVTVMAGEIDGSVTITPAATPAVSVTLSFCLGAAGCATPYTEVMPVGASAPFTAYLPPGTYTVTAAGGTFTAVSVGPEVLANNADITGVTVGLS